MYVLVIDYGYCVDCVGDFWCDLYDIDVNLFVVGSGCLFVMVLCFQCYKGGDGDEVKGQGIVFKQVMGWFLGRCSLRVDQLVIESQKSLVFIIFFLCKI